MARLACCLALSLLTVGCASPGPPRAPSLHLPEPVADLAAERVGDAVVLTFTVPHLSTDKLPLYNAKSPGTTLRGVICRELEHSGCTTLAGIAPALTANDHTIVTYNDVLPKAWVSGTPRLLRYRVEFFNAAGRSAGPSAPALALTGEAPPPVSGLRVRGTRSGVLLTWAPEQPPTGEVLIERTGLAQRSVPQPAVAQAKPAAAPAGRKDHANRPGGSAALPGDRHWLNANASANQSPNVTPDATLDATVVSHEPYSYRAVRRIVVQREGHSLELRSPPSAPVEITLTGKYPPPAPTGLTATAFQPGPATAGANHFAVDLIWQPVVDDAGVPATLVPPVVGYNVYRQTLAPEGKGSPVRLNTTPVSVPGYHDATADPATPYLYAVTAVDANGNEGPPATFQLP